MGVKKGQSTGTPGDLCTLWLLLSSFSGISPYPYLNPPADPRSGPGGPKKGSLSVLGTKNPPHEAKIAQKGGGAISAGAVFGHFSRKMAKKWPKTALSLYSEATPLSQLVSLARIFFRID